MRRLILNSRIQRQSIRQHQLHTPLHLRLKSLELFDCILKHTSIAEILHAQLGFEYICAAHIKKLQGRKWRETGLGFRFEVAHAGLVQDAVEEDDDVAQNEAVAFNIVLCDEAEAIRYGRGMSKRMAYRFGPVAIIWA